MEKKKLNILMTNDTFYPVIGGVSTVMDNSAIELSKYANVTIVCVKAKGYTDPEKPYKVIRCNGYYNKITKDGMAYPTLDKKFRKKIEEMDIDVIHCHTAGNLMTYFLKVAKKRNIPLVSSVHNCMYEDAKHYIKSPLIAKWITKGFMKKTNKSDQVWCVSQYCKDFLLKYNLREDAIVVRNAVSITPEISNLSKDELKKSLNINPSTFVFIYICRLIKTKNLDLIIDSVNLIKDKIRDYKVILVGSGNYEQKAKNRIKKLGLEKYFIFTGMIRDRNLLGKYYQISDVITCASIIEAACLIVPEGAAYSVPSITIKGYAPSENITDGYNGFISENAPEIFSESMIYCYNNRQNLPEIGKNANATLYKTYKDKQVINELLTLYQNVADLKKNKK